MDRVRRSARGAWKDQLVVSACNSQKKKVSYETLPECGVKIEGYNGGDRARTRSSPDADCGSCDVDKSKERREAMK